MVAGGLDNRNSPVLEVEFLSTSSYSNWKVLGLLKLPRFGFPTVGQILGNIFVKESYALTNLIFRKASNCWGSYLFNK